ncbi:MAG: STAS domain-containing protein [Cyclobacteriaceae bacterium]
MIDMVETTINETASYYEIIISGEIDAGSSISLDNELEIAFQGEQHNILLNLEGLNYISSAGLGVFIARLEEISEKSINLIFYGLQENVKQVFALLGLEELLTIYNSKKEAIASLK